MVDNEGPVAIVSRRQRGENRKVDLIVTEVKRYNVKVIGLQETKWFGCDVYDVARSVVLTSRRPVPDKAGNFQRGEGFNWAGILACNS